jgi:hypothetical protein
MLRLGPVDRNFSLGKFAVAHSINPFGNHDLRVLIIPDCPAENTSAAFPAHRIAGSPFRAYSDRDRGGRPALALACFARLARW